MRRRVLLLVALAVVGACLTGIPGAAAATRDLGPYRGLGTWVDVFDYAARTQPEGAPLPVTPDSVADMASLGVDTLYLQVVNPVGERPEVLYDSALLGEFLSAAHDHDVEVVAWYLPSFADDASDLATIRAIASFDVDGEEFDAIALDLEDTTTVPDVAARNDRLVDLAKRTRKVIGSDRALGAIVYPAVQTEIVNPILWPGFPYRRLAPSVDVWMPMAYYTFRDTESGYRDPIRYTEESVQLLRSHLRDAKASVHVIGGIADLSTPEDHAAFLRAADRTDAIGHSMYDYRTTSSAAWPLLRGDVRVPSTDDVTTSGATG
jgi:hypothetical protein